MNNPNEMSYIEHLKELRSRLLRVFVVAGIFLICCLPFANEIYSLCKGLDIKYSELVRLVSYEERVGNSHLTVPGPDGKMGFGGSCFPKDMNSLITIFKNQDIESFVLAAAWERNIKIDRTEQDWKKLKGRAVSSKD